MTLGNLSFLDIEPKVHIKRAWVGSCIGCSPTNPHGLKLEFTAVKNYCYTKIIVPKDYCGFEGITHGGIVSLLLDETAGWTITTNLFRFGFTKTANISFLKPCPTETTLIVVGKIESSTENQAIVKSSIFLENGLLVAEMSSTWHLPSMEQAMKITGRNVDFLRNFNEEVFTELKKVMSNN